MEQNMSNGSAMDDRTINVLLVDDVEADRVLMERTIKDGGYPLTVQHAMTFEQARERLNNGTIFDVVMLDLTLPDMQGLDSLVALRKEFKSIPIVVTAGVSDSRMALGAGQKGADGFVLKDQLGTSAGICAIYCALGHSLSAHERRAHNRVVTKDLLERMKQIKSDPRHLPITSVQALEL